MKMSPALSLSVIQFPLCKSQDLSKDTNNPKIFSKETPCQKSYSDARINRRKLLGTSGLSLVAGTLAKPARAETEAPIEATSSRMSYSRFLEYLNEGAVKKVDFFESSAVAEIFNPALNKVQRVKVQLPGLPPELVRKLREKDVDFAAHLPEMNVIGPLLDLLGNLAFPLILLGSLLLRTSSSNTPGGPNLPFGLGRYVLYIASVTVNLLE